MYNDPLKLYTYEDIADMLNVSVGTVRNWKYQKLFRIKGYRKIRGVIREAVVSLEEVEKLQIKKLLPPKN